MWFVDSDDNINPAVFGVVRQFEQCGYDYLDFGIERFADAGGPIRPSIGARAGVSGVPKVRTTRSRSRACFSCTASGGW